METGQDRLERGRGTAAFEAVPASGQIKNLYLQPLHAVRAAFFPPACVHFPCRTSVWKGKFPCLTRKRLAQTATPGHKYRSQEIAWRGRPPPGGRRTAPGPGHAVPSFFASSVLLLSRRGGPPPAAICGNYCSILLYHRPLYITSTIPVRPLARRRMLNPGKAPAEPG